MMLKLKYFLLVTLYFQLFNVEPAPLEPITTVRSSLSSELDSPLKKLDYYS